MNTDKMHAFTKRWNQILKQQKDLDWSKSVFARDLLTECGGTKVFIRFCQSDLGLTEGQAQELASRADSLKIVPDADTYARLGGFSKISQLQPLPRREQVAVIEAAKVQVLSIPTVLRQRGSLGVPVKPGRSLLVSVTPSKAAPNPVPLRGAARDASVLARFIQEVVPSGKVTREVRAILEIYLPAYSKAA